MHLFKLCSQTFNRTSGTGLPNFWEPRYCKDIKEIIIAPEIGPKSFRTFAKLCPMLAVDFEKCGRESLACDNAPFICAYADGHTLWYWHMPTFALSSLLEPMLCFSSSTLCSIGNLKHTSLPVWVIDLLNAWISRKAASVGPNFNYQFIAHVGQQR